MPTTPRKSAPAAKPADAPAAEQLPAIVPPLPPASESSDPAVHYLIAQRSAHTDNGDQQAAEAVTAQLAELGYR